VAPSFSRRLGGGETGIQAYRCENVSSRLPSWITYPKREWLPLSPGEAGLDQKGFDEFLASLSPRGANVGGEDHAGTKWGAVLTRAGYLLHSWGDPNYRFQTASTGKAFIWVLLGLAESEGLLNPDEPIHYSWTGKNLLSHAHKYLDSGHHAKLTWRHMIGDQHGTVHYGGFPMELGNRWTARESGMGEFDATPGVPEWAQWTGDPFFDLYAHAEPGSVGIYSSAGFWRLSQALTAVWGTDLKAVLDERIFSRIGIRADAWDWNTGYDVKMQPYFYPSIPNTYTYLDPPYEIDGVPVRSGPGWVVISASDLARFGHLIAAGGVWEGEDLVDRGWLRGHGGGNGSGVSGEGKHFTSLAVVATEGLSDELPQWHNTTSVSFIPESLFTGPVRATGSDTEATEPLSSKRDHSDVG
jgi:CubicO group peptidase (beta-lactamase class C family)